MLAATPNWGAIAIVGGIVLAAAFGLVIGWQCRGYHEHARRGNEINLTGVRR